MLEDGSGVHISTTRYYTPKGNSLAETGVTPDRVVEMPLEDIYSLASGKLADADDEQLQAAIAILNQEIAELPVEETGEQTDETTTPAE
jgi:carboxyl-terminal processing protease